MSVKVLTAVFELSEARGNDRLVLLALADYASDETWSCYPSVGSVAKKARVSERTAQRCLKSLREDGHVAVLERIASRYGTNRYVVLRPWEDRQSDTRQVDTPDNLTPDRTGDEGCQNARPGVTLLTPEPSLEQPSVEPSSSSPAAKRKTKDPRGERIPDEFFITAEMREWAQLNGITVDLAEHTRRFCDYWRAQPGARGRKADWVATWRNWMRRQQDDAGRDGPRTKSDKQAAAIDAVRDSWRAS